jgi:hypothetical protein
MPVPNHSTPYANFLRDLPCPLPQRRWRRGHLHLRLQPRLVWHGGAASGSQGGNGPHYTKAGVVYTVTGNDPYRLDGNNKGERMRIARKGFGGAILSGL